MRDIPGKGISITRCLKCPSGAPCPSHRHGCFCIYRKKAPVVHSALWMRSQYCGTSKCCRTSRQTARCRQRPRGGRRLRNRKQGFYFDVQEIIWNVRRTKQNGVGVEERIQIKTNQEKVGCKNQLDRLVIKVINVKKVPCKY